MPRTNAQKLAAIQSWLGIKTLGVYVGIESYQKPLSYFENLAQQFENEGVDYGIIKFGEWGNLWYPVEDIWQIFLKHRRGMAPYYFIRPQSLARDTAICIDLARKRGGIILDAEEPYINQPSALASIVNAIRTEVPDAVIIISGYGDPEFAFGNSWPYAAMQQADGYQPQAYIGYWDVYKNLGWQYAIGWADGQCAQAFKVGNLGLDFPIQWAVNTQGVNEADIEPLAKYLMQWKESIAVWEVQDLTAPEVQLFKRGESESNVIAPPVVTPPAPPAPGPQPSPVPEQPKDVTIYIDQGDTMSTTIIVTAHQAGFNGTWQELLQAKNSAGETVISQLDAIAKGFGHPDGSNGGYLVFPKTHFTFIP